MKINLQKTLLGRTLRRLVGEEKGAVMMEYVVLAVLLVAACVAAVIFFGDRIAKQFKGAGEAAGGQVQTAGTTVTGANSAFQQNMQDAVKDQQVIQGGELKSK